MNTKDKINKAKRLAIRVYNCEYFGLSGYVKAKTAFDNLGICEYWENMETDDVTISERKAERWIERGEYVKYHAINARG
jgi:hypothetical protein